MARALDARLARLEHVVAERRMRQIFAVEAAKLGMDPTTLLHEIEAFLALPLAEQLEEVDRLAVEMAAEGIDVEEMRATLMREHRPR